MFTPRVGGRAFVSYSQYYRQHGSVGILKYIDPEGMIESGNEEALSLTDKKFSRERDVAVAAALEAGHQIRRYAGRVKVESIREKAVNDLVTSVDLESQRIIIEKLNAHFPDYEMLAEEGDEHVGVSPVTTGYRWIVDPIDGTTNFMHGVPPYAVSIALQYENTIVLGVVLDVSRGELFSAIRGCGLYVNGVRAHVSLTDTLGSSLLSTGFPYRRYEHVDSFLAVLREFLQKAQGLRRPGAASVDMAWVACGRFEGFYETGLCPWDVAAGRVLVEEGGGHVTDFSGKGDPIFDRQIVASNGQIHTLMLDVLEPMRGIRL